MWLNFPAGCCVGSSPDVEQHSWREFWDQTSQSCSTHCSKNFLSAHPEQRYRTGYKNKEDFIFALKEGNNLVWVWDTHTNNSFAKTETSHFNYQACLASKSSFSECWIYSWWFISCGEEMVLMWILSFLIQSFVYFIDDGSFPQKFVADKNTSVVR